MCVSLGTFVTDLLKGGFILCWLLLWFLQVTHLKNNYRFMLCICQMLSIHQLQLACFDVFSGDLDFDGLFSPEISLIE